MARITFPERTITSQAKYGQKIEVESHPHVRHFGVPQQGPSARSPQFRRLVGPGAARTVEIYGTKRSLSVPDPNSFGGPVASAAGRSSGLGELPLTRRCAESSPQHGCGRHGLRAQRPGRPHRASPELVYRVLDLMHSFTMPRPRDPRGTRQHLPAARPAAPGSALATRTPESHPAVKDPWDSPNSSRYRRSPIPSFRPTASGWPMWRRRQTWSTTSTTPTSLVPAEGCLLQAHLWPQTGRHPRWSPDGSWIAFISVGAR